MPENNIDKLNLPELWAFIVVMITGAIGGCTGAFANRANEKRIITAMSIGGYTVTGIFGALIYFASSSMFTDTVVIDINKLILPSLFSGFSTSLALAGVNFGFKIILKKINLELEITIRRLPKRKK